LDDPNLTKIEQMPDIKTQVEDFADKSALDYQINQRLNNPDLLGTSDVSSAVDFIMGRFDAEKQAQSEMKAKIKSKFPDATEIQILAAMRRTFPDMEPSPEAIAEYEKITGKSMSGPMFGIFPATTGARKAFDAYVEESISNLKPNTPAEAPESNPTPITPPVQSMPINGTLSTETDLSSINDKLDSIRDEILDSVSRPNLNIIQPPPYESIAGGGVPPATSNPRTNVSVYTHNPESSISDYNNSIFDAMV
jgi:hypothetical protein